MSTITVTNIKATGETASRAVSGVAAAWVNFDQDPATLEDSSNISSLTDNGTSDHTLSFSSSFGNNRYAVSGAAQALSNSNGSAQSFPLFTIEGTLSPSSSASRIFMRSARDTYGLYDYNNVTASYHGDLA